MRLRSHVAPFVVVAAPVIAAACGGHDPLPPVATPIAVLPAASWTPASTAPTTVATVDEPKLPVPGVDEAAIDPSVDPCEDFYAYACGGWQKSTPIPADRAAWTRSFSEINERNEKILRETLEKDAAGKGDPGDTYAKKLGDFWNACMDEAGIEKRGTEPLKAPFGVIDSVKDEKTAAAAIRTLYAMGYNPLFNFSSGQDAADATKVIGQLEQGGLGLPDRDYYLKSDAKSVDIRDKYLEHVKKVLALIGDPAQNADEIMALETQLAKVSMTRVDRRDPKKTYHKMTLANVKGLAPSLDWDSFVDTLGVGKSAPINVAQPDFFKGVEKIAKKTKPEVWKMYLRWDVVRELEPMMPKAFVDEGFRFKSTALTGAKQILPRWKRCVTAANEALGEALAQPFVKQTFGNEGKARSVAMVGEIEASMSGDLKTLAWMDEPTRKKAFDKLHKINNKIGFPDAWRNYDSLEIGADYARNMLSTATFEMHRNLAKIGKPVDRKEWYMTPPTVNAYYDANLNEMVFPAGILQPPFFDRMAPASTNYGGIGMVMGHELTHGFDDEGRQFDGDGNLKEWWSKKVGAEFDKRAQCVVDQFDGFVAVDDLHVNGKLTLGENIADLGGIKLTYAAFEKMKASRTEKVERKSKFDEEQELFLGFAQVWCQNARPEMRRALTSTDPHSPPKYRVNGPLSNLPAFATAFQCKASSAMVKKDRCEIW